MNHWAFDRIDPGLNDCFALFQERLRIQNELYKVTSVPLAEPRPSPADIAEQIMRAIEADQAIHKDTLIRIITQALGNDR